MIYHMCPAEAWQEACTPANPRHGDDLRDGSDFSTAPQIVERARATAPPIGADAEFAVEFDEYRGSARWEKSRGGDLFPHLYGPLDPSEAASVRLFPLGPDRLFTCSRS